MLDNYHTGYYNIVKLPYMVNGLGGELMYSNMQNLMDSKGITHAIMGELIGCSSKTVYNKINEKTEWTLGEITRIKTFLFPEYDLDYLLKTD